MKNTPVVQSSHKVEQSREMISELFWQYQYEYITAMRHASKIQRDLSRAEHEVNRIKQHLSRIEVFCEKNNIKLIGINDRL